MIKKFLGGVGRVLQVAKRRLSVVCDSALWPSRAEAASDTLNYIYYMDYDVDYAKNFDFQIMYGYHGTGLTRGGVVTTL